MKFFHIFLFLLFFPALVCAADIKIIEAQTGSATNALDECVKVKNNGNESFSLLGLILQSRGVSSTSTWQSRSGAGLPDINIDAGETVILGSKSYTGTDAIWEHIVNWGLSDNGGGVRLIAKNKDGSIAEIFAEKYWDNSESQPEEPVPTPEPIIETTTPEPEPIQETPAEQPDDTTPNILSPSPANAEEILIPAKEINIQISEFIPNPSGSDDGEWIEIKNILNEPSDISGWFLDDEDGGSKPYKFPENTIIPANGFLVFYKIQTKLALNNDADLVRILKPAGEIAEKIDYSGCAEGMSYARGTDKWSWTTSPTPSLQNIITAPAPKKSSASNPLSTVYGEITKTNKASFYILEEDGDEIKINLPAENLAVGDKVEITGTVKKTASGNQITPKKQTDIIIKDKAPAEKENTATNPNLKYYIVLGMGLCSVAGMEGWKKREFFKLKYKQLFDKSEAQNPKSETNSAPEAHPPLAENTKYKNSKRVF